MAEKFAFIGLGAMGFPMAANVRKGIPSNVPLAIYDVDQAACDRFVQDFDKHGPIQISKSPKDAVTDANVVISIIPSAKIVRNVYLDETSGIIAATPNSNRMLYECSTIDSETTKQVGKAIRDAGAGTYIDTPVSGGVPAAEKGSLSFLIGHAKESDASIKHIERTLGMMGAPEKFFWCGQLGAGLAAKISNNYLSCSILLAISEAMAIGVRSGIDPALLHEVIHNSSGQSWMLDNVQPIPGVVPHAPSSNGYKLGFKTQMMPKDIGLGIEAAEMVGIEPSIARAALSVYEAAARNPKCIDKDGSSVYLHITDN